MYAAFPPLKTGADSPRGVSTFSPKGTPPSSQYCSHRSLSRISAAARNRRMAASSRLSAPPLFADAFGAAPIMDAPGAKSIAPTPSRRKNERRGNAFGAKTRLAGNLVEAAGSWPFAVRPSTFGFVGVLIVFMPPESRSSDCRPDLKSNGVVTFAENQLQLTTVRESSNQHDVPCE